MVAADSLLDAAAAWDTVMGEGLAAVVVCRTFSGPDKAEGHSNPALAAAEGSLVLGLRVAQAQASFYAVVGNAAAAALVVHTQENPHAAMAKAEEESCLVAVAELV